MNKNNADIKKVGLWMDHEEAKFIEPKKEQSSIRSIHANSPGLIRHTGESSDGTKLGQYRSSNNEFSKHRKEENNIREYFESLVEQLQSYDEIFIFGPTTAAVEFKNYLSKEKVLSDKKIHMEKADYLTEPQLLKAVKEYFASPKPR